MANSKSIVLLFLLFICVINEADLAISQASDVRQDTNSPSTTIGEGNPQIWGTNVVWCERDSNDQSQIMFWKGATSIQISAGGNECYNPQIWETNVVWQEKIAGKFQIMFWNGTACRQISSGNNECRNPQIWGTNVVWQEKVLGKYHIVFWDGTKPGRISSGKYDCENPQIWETKVVWLENISGKYRVMFWDGTVAKQLAGNIKETTLTIKDSTLQN
jgi:hypothetical protein